MHQVNQQVNHQVLEQIVQQVKTTSEEILYELSINKDITVKPNTIPIVLIDNSGSTSSKIHKTDILHHEIKTIKKILSDLSYVQCYIMYWNTSEKHNKEAVNVSELERSLQTLHITSTGGTDISVAIHNIPDQWYQKETTIYIVTDGEVNADRYSFDKQIFNLTKRYIIINIITVEHNNVNYSEDLVSAGANIYKVIQDSKLSKYIRSFECFNEYHVTKPFINFYNPEVKKGQFSFKEYVFSDQNFDMFVKTICDMILEHTGNKDYLEKLMYHLSFSLYFFTKGKTQRITNEVVRLFVSLFEEEFDDLEYVTDIFESEIKNHSEGTSKTYQQYRENRKKLFEKTSDDLHNSVSECFAKGNEFMSFIINTTDVSTKYIIQSNMTNSYVRLSDSYYNNGGISYGDHFLPMLSVETIDHEHASQSLRQWIRAIYSRVHSIQVNDERILYLLLTDMMSVVLSDLPDNIKKGYKNCARVMLDAKRFNSGDLKQIVFLTSGNKPRPMLSGYFTMNEILTQCRTHLFGENNTVTNNDLWYGICCAYGYTKLSNAQIPKDYDIEELVERLKQNNSIYILEKIEVKKELEYKDYLTLEDISTEGGYKFPDRKFRNKIFESNIMISNKTYDELLSKEEKTITCPITGAKVELTKLVKIDKKDLEPTIIHDDSMFDMKIFNKKYFQRVNIKELDLMNLQNLDIKSVSEYDFTNYPYEFYPPVPIITEKLYKEKEQYRTKEDFISKVKERYEWLNGLNMENIVVAGGFNKSIILDEKVNDVDIYIHYLEDEELKYQEVLSRLVGDITKEIEKKYDNIAYLVAYKKEFNVYELIYFENINKLEKDKFEVQDLTQMKFIAKIQIIMKKHLEPKQIFNIYDIDPCTTYWDGKDLYFTDRSYLAYRYMISIPRIDKHYTDTFDMRLLKYYKSGFRIALPRLTIDQIKERLSEDNTLIINKCKFYVSQIDNYNIYVDKCELLVEKIEKEQNAILQTGMNGYGSVIGDIGSLDDSRSIVKFMKYVQRQNRLVERVQKHLDSGETVSEQSILNDIDQEMKKELSELKFKGKKYVKQDALLSDDENDEEDCDDSNSVELERVSIEVEPIEVTPIEVTPIEVEPIEVTPIEVEPIEVTPIEVTPIEVTLIEVEPIEVTPIEVEPIVLKQPEEYIRVYYRVSTSKDTRKMNEFDNGTCELKFIWTYENYHKSKDWYHSVVNE